MSKKKHKKKKKNKHKKKQTPLKQQQTQSTAPSSQPQTKTAPPPEKTETPATPPTKTKETNQPQVAASSQATSTETSDLKRKRSWLLALSLVGVAVVIFAFIYRESLLLIPQKYLLILAIIPVIIEVMVALVAGKLVYQASHKFSLSHELTHKDNPAVGVILSGYLIGVAVAISGSLTGIFGQGEVREDLLIACLSGLFGAVLALPLVLISGWINDRMILHKFSVAKEIVEDRNVGAAAVCFGSFVATGLILMSSFIGEGGNSWQGLLLSILASYVLGQLVLIVGSFLFQKVVSYDFSHEIEEQDNLSAGILLGSFLIALGLVVSASITGISVDEQGSWLYFLSRLGISAAAGAVGILLLITTGIVTAKVIFPKVSLDEEVCQKNAAVSMVLAAVYLTVGVLIQTLLHIG